ncbi:MAG: redoxin domain-containing protein [Patescibacteria group bacterium]
MKNKQNPLTTVLTLVAIAVFVLGGMYFLNNKSGTQSAVGDGNATSNDALEGLVGKPVPEFSLRDKNGVVYSPEALRGKNTILFFNEGIMCYPSCWNQIVALQEDKRLQSDDTIGLSIVIDTPEDWRRAAERMPELGFAKILFDIDKSVSRKFGMLTSKSSMHYGSFPGHSYVLIDKAGIVRYVYDDPNMAINNNLLVSQVARL